MRQASIFHDALQPGPIPWALQMKAISRDEPSRAVKSLSGAILACGGWVLSRSASETGLIEILFEFERRSCLEILDFALMERVIRVPHHRRTVKLWNHLLEQF